MKLLLRLVPAEVLQTAFDYRRYQLGSKGIAITPMAAGDTVKVYLIKVLRKTALKEFKSMRSGQEYLVWNFCLFSLIKRVIICCTDWWVQFIDAWHQFWKLPEIYLKKQQQKHPFMYGFVCNTCIIFKYRRGLIMMTSSNGNIFRVTGHLCGEFTSHRWIPRTKASDAELWFFFICAWIHGWVNNRKACYLRRHDAHYDVSVMS